MLATIAGCSSSNSSSGGSCSTDSSVSCSSGTGWSCSGDAQPEDSNQDLVCSTDGAGDFCCASSSCGFDPNISCVSGASGYSCAIGAAPPDQSDATLVCSVPTAGASDDEYCCFTNTTTASGSTCEQDPSVTGCVPNSYGFSCTGSENPDVDYSNLNCSTTGTPGTNAQGAPATLYCCTY
jgi:hypothetical protein